MEELEQGDQGLLRVIHLQERPGQAGHVAAVEEVREASDLLHLEHRHLGGSQSCRRSAGRENLPAELHQPAGKGDDPAFVADRD